MTHTRDQILACFRDNAFRLYMDSLFVGWRQWDDRDKWQWADRYLTAKEVRDIEAKRKRDNSFI